MLGDALKEGCLKIIAYFPFSAKLRKPLLLMGIIRLFDYIRNLFKIMIFRDRLAAFPFELPFLLKVKKYGAYVRLVV